MGLGIAKQAGDPFDEFLDSLKQPRQVMEQHYIEPIEDELPEDTDEETEQETQESPEEQKRRYSLSMIPAETLVNCVDLAFTQVNSIIAKQKVEGATDEEKDSLIQAAANYMKEKEIDISPGSMLVVMVLIIYAPKVYQAVELRRANEKNERLQRELEAHKRQIERLKKKNSSPEEEKEDDEDE